MRKYTGETGRIERDGGMFYFEFPTTFKEMPDGVKETEQRSEEAHNRLNNLVCCPVGFASYI
ncbi:hypothetical protein HYT26_00930 [Candidatus Pacearchaeota archaeon]|nr:hypothetical protein [Candidatus Pacearchaeota archaeon]